jgi:iron only hydrogenase large subunit-like protein
MQSLYEIDQRESLRTSHANASVKRLYEEFLGEPLGHRSHQLLHTHYNRREVVV